MAHSSPKQPGTMTATAHSQRVSWPPDTKGLLITEARSEPTTTLSAHLIPGWMRRQDAPRGSADHGSGGCEGGPGWCSGRRWSRCSRRLRKPCRAPPRWCRPGAGPLCRTGGRIWGPPPRRSSPPAWCWMASWSFGTPKRVGRRSGCCSVGPPPALAAPPSPCGGRPTSLLEYVRVHRRSGRARSRRSAWWGPVFEVSFKGVRSPQLLTDIASGTRDLRVHGRFRNPFLGHWQQCGRRAGRGLLSPCTSLCQSRTADQRAFFFAMLAEYQWARDAAGLMPGTVDSWSSRRWRCASTTASCRGSSPRL